MTKPSLFDNEDLHALEEEMADVIPLPQGTITPYRHRPPPRPIAQPDYLRERHEWEDTELSEQDLITEEWLSYARPGIQKKLLSDLKRGFLELELSLDLHGFRVQPALETLERFLAICQQRRARCVHIIHGKGHGSEERQPILKQKLNYWLRLRKDVLAFCSATRRDGGNGALYVLLKHLPGSRNRPHG